MDCYKVLKVNKKASWKEIKKAYEKLIIEHHPDTSIDNKPIEDFLNIRKAYKILKNQHKYDNFDYTNIRKAFYDEYQIVKNYIKEMKERDK